MASALLIAVGLGRPAAAQPLMLADDGATNYQIVLPQACDVATRAVAEDMADTLRQITGATFPVVDDRTATTPHEIVLGSTNARLAPLELENLAADLTADAYEIRTIEQNLVIVGAPPRGTINGIYGFLQDHLGCRWFTPEVSRIPQQRRLMVEPIEEHQHPAFRQRSTTTAAHWDAAWTARNRLNVCKTYGGAVSQDYLMRDPRVATIGNYYEAHAMSGIPDELHKAHPEYYALIDGRRRLEPGDNQQAFCITNAGFADYVAQRLIRTLGDRRGPTTVGLGHADSANHCRCENCMAAYEREGLSGTYMAFANGVAEHVADASPHAMIDTLAYGMTFAPTAVRMHPNIRPTWCPITACYVHGLSGCNASRERELIPQLQHWLQNTHQLQVWYYHFQSDGLLPHPRMAATARDFKTFHRLGVDDLFVEPVVGAACIRTNPDSDGDKLIPAFGDPSSHEYFTIPYGLNHLRMYLVSRLMWDTAFDVETGIAEFCETYYGAAAPQMVAYVKAVENIRSYDKTLDPTFRAYHGVHGSSTMAPRMHRGVQERLDALFDEAERAVAEAPAFRRRVRMARLSLQLSILCHVPNDDSLWRKSFDGFFALTEELGLKYVNRTPLSFERLTLAEFKTLIAKDRTPEQTQRGRNLLQNSGFEIDQDADGVPDAWLAEGEYLPETFALDRDGVVLDGQAEDADGRRVRLTARGARGRVTALRQMLDVEPGQTYRAAIRYRSEMDRGSVVLICSAYAADGRWIRNLSGVRGARVTDGAWQNLNVDVTPPQGASRLAVQVVLYDDQARGHVWVDDARLCEMR